MILYDVVGGGVHLFHWVSLIEAVLYCVSTVLLYCTVLQCTARYCAVLLYCVDCIALLW